MQKTATVIIFETEQLAQYINGPMPYQLHVVSLLVSFHVLLAAGA